MSRNNTEEKSSLRSLASGCRATRGIAGLGVRIISYLIALGFGERWGNDFQKGSEIGNKKSLVPAGNSGRMPQSRPCETQHNPPPIRPIIAMTPS